MKYKNDFNRVTERRGNIYVEYLVLALIVLIATVRFSTELIAPPQVGSGPPIATSTTLTAPAGGSAAAAMSPRAPLWSVLRTNFDRLCGQVVGTGNCQ